MPEITLIDLIFYLLLVDSIGAIFVAFGARGWYLDKVGIMARWFPPAKGWAVLYFALALLLVLQNVGLL